MVAGTVAGAATSRLLRGGGYTAPVRMACTQVDGACLVGGEDPPPLDPCLGCYADEVLREAARRLLGRRPGLHLVEAKLQPANAPQAAAWVGTAAYLRGRLQPNAAAAAGSALPSHAAAPPPLAPDLSAAAVAALLDVLDELGREIVHATRRDASLLWATMRHLSDGGEEERFHITGYVAVDLESEASSWVPSPLLVEPAVRDSVARVWMESWEAVLWELTTPHASEGDYRLRSTAEGLEPPPP